jgi:hypothetical protein
MTPIQEAFQVPVKHCNQKFPAPRHLPDPDDAKIVPTAKVKIYVYSFHIKSDLLRVYTVLRLKLTCLQLKFYEFGQNLP